jgi:hypothetical protein
MASKTLVRGVVGASSAWRSVAAIRPAFLRSTPAVAPLQYRFASSQPGNSEDRAPYEKGERVGNKSFSQFDIGGKVFVVTGAAARCYPSAEHHNCLRDRC